jgi:hypothetical protein
VLVLTHQRPVPLSAEFTSTATFVLVWYRSIDSCGTDARQGCTVTHHVPEA